MTHSEIWSYQKHFYLQSQETTPMTGSHSLKRTLKGTENLFKTINFLKELWAVSHNRSILLPQTTASDQAGGITITFEAQEKLLERKWRQGVNKEGITHLQGRN